jgi:hypothetical protein
VLFPFFLHSGGTCFMLDLRFYYALFSSLFFCSTTGRLW